MELFTGRVTADAKVNTLKDERQVVNFSVAINDYYKAKNSEEGTKVVTYVNCSYWLNAKIAERLTKGAVVEIAGRLHVNAYKNMDGEPKASLNCHVNHIKIHHSTKEITTTEQPAATAAVDDLPF
ncbi:MAG: single-stranded DNA-binding protein [Chitinophagaceae bacterium]|nr:single-stranded DNA-binding protein [Chitinophagaceae bacterium]